MEMTVMLLLLTPLTAAMALQHNHGPHTDKVSLGRSIQMSDIVSSVAVEKTDTGNPPLHLSADTHLQSILVRSKTGEVRLRRRRAASKGCQFGTCQMQNLASTLYRMGQTNNKEQSKGAEDPNGYGR
ncbi:uncharacterized protein LOC106578347 [Tachysurus ichikawai]